MPEDLFRFEDLELDARRYVLRRGAKALKMERIPMELLLLLVERRGQLVTREEIIEKLWGRDIFLDTDNSINTAIRKIRQALGDDPVQPRFVLTIAGKGYRFIAPVTAVSETHGSGEAASAQPASSISAPGGATLGGAGAVESGQPPVRAAATEPPTGKQWWKKRPAGAVTVLTLATALVLAARYTFPRPSAAIHSIAVLPFANDSRDPSTDYLSDGLTEAVIEKLSQVPELRVMSRTSVFRLRTRDADAVAVGRTLKVQAILVGRIVDQTDAVSISTEMVNVADGSHLWGQQYKYRLSDLPRAPEELASAITGKLRLRLMPEETARLARRPTENAEAYQFYLQGLYQWNQRTPAGTRKSIEDFQKAVEKDPHFALAYVGIANSYNSSSLIGGYTPLESFPQAKAAATKALMLDPLLADAHTALGIVKAYYEFDWEGGKTEFLRAIELNPESADAHRAYAASYLLPMRRGQEAIAETNKAVALDPLSVPLNNFLATTYLFAGEYDRAVEQYRRVIEMDPNFPRGHLMLGSLLADLGRYDEAVPEFEMGEILAGTAPDRATGAGAAMRQAWATGGDKAYWQQYLAFGLESMREGDKAWFGNTDIAEAYAHLGDKDKAFQWLEKAYQGREGIPLSIIKSDPGFRNLWDDARLKQLLRRLRLPE